MSQVKLKSERLIITCKTMWETYNGFWLGATILKAMKHSSPKKTKSKKRKQLEHFDLKYHLLEITRAKGIQFSKMQIKIKINLKIVERAVRVLLGEFHLGLISFSSNIMSSFPAKITHNQRRKSLRETLSSEITLNEQNWKNRKCCLVSLFYFQSLKSMFLIRVSQFLKCGQQF